jgi:hypothetical protein
MVYPVPAVSLLRCWCGNPYICFIKDVVVTDKAGSRCVRLVTLIESAQSGVIREISRKAGMNDDAHCLVNLSDEMMKVCIAARAVSVMGSKSEEQFIIHLSNRFRKKFNT